MALIQCSECGNEISDKAITCPHCGATKTKVRVSRKISNRSTKKSILPLKTIAIVSFVLLCMGVFFGRSILPFMEGAPKPIIIKSHLDDSRTNLLKYRIAVHATIKNEGLSGKIATAFHVYQNGKEYMKNKSLSLKSNEERELEETFEEVKMLDGKITYRVEAKPE